MTGGWGARKVPRPTGGIPLDTPIGGRFAVPDQAVTPDENRTRRPRWPLVVGALVLAVVVGSGVWWQYLRPQQNDPDIIGPTSGKTDVIKVQRGDEAVRGYLAALKAGDARTALSYGRLGGPGSQVLLTEAALKDSLARAPIENVVVPDADANASQIPAQYTIGGETVNTVFKVARTDDGGWQLARTTASIQITAARSDRVPLVVNGVALPDVQYLELLPGSYHFTTGLPFLAYSEQTDIKVPSLEYAEPLRTLPLEITPEGRTALTEAGKASTTACLARQDLAPPNCPFQAANLGRPIKQSSIRWELTNDPWSTASWTLNASDPAVSEATLLFTITLSVEFENGDRSPDNPVGSGKVSMITDISRTRAADLEVKWTPL